MTEKLYPLFQRILNAKYIHLENDADYAVEQDGTTLYLLFQWSNSKLDWVSNFDFPATSYKDGSDRWYAHRGFLRVWKTIREPLEKEVSEILEKCSIDKIICAGYSHGAAIAGFATEDMEYLYGLHNEVGSGPIEIEGYGFGCPRFAWGALPADVRDRFKNFVPIRDCKDLVTHVPPAIFGFRHVGTLLQIGKDAGYKPIESHYPEKYSIESLNYDLKEESEHGDEE